MDVQVNVFDCHWFVRCLVRWGAWFHFSNMLYMYLVHCSMICTLHWFSAIDCLLINSEEVFLLFSEKAFIWIKDYTNTILLYYKQLELINVCLVKKEISWKVEKRLLFFIIVPIFRDQYCKLDCYKQHRHKRTALHSSHAPRCSYCCHVTA